MERFTTYKRIHIIACRVLLRELSAAIATSPLMVDVTFLPQGLHNTPKELNRLIKEEIDRIYANYRSGAVSYLPDAIVLGYGLCSNAVLGLSGGDIPLIAPRADDCMALFLGSAERYMREFQQHNGTYWLNNGWIEASRIPDSAYMKTLRAEFEEKYGEENADFLMEQEMLWTKKYKTCGFIDSPLYHADGYVRLAETFAADYGWDFFRIPGDGRLIEFMANGIYPDADFLTCPAGCRIAASYDERKVKSERIQPEVAL